MRRLEKLIRDRGLLWTALYAIRFVFLKASQRLDVLLVGIEKRRFLTGQDTIAARYHTVADNRRIWSQRDWSKGGEEWTLDARSLRGLDPARWKKTLVERMMLDHLPQGSTVLEIGPGAGRWTQELLTRAQRLILADISEQCLGICRKKFKGDPRIECHLVEGDRLSFIDDERVDFVWSYDVFVHVNPTDTEKYIMEFERIMKPGAYGVIHHPDSYPDEAVHWRNFRSFMDGRFFAHLVSKHRMKVIEQDTRLVHRPGDMITVFSKPSRRDPD